jgi:hypothetical protein
VLSECDGVIVPRGWLVVWWHLIIWSQSNRMKYSQTRKVVTYCSEVSEKISKKNLKFKNSCFQQQTSFTAGRVCFLNEDCEGGFPFVKEQDIRAQKVTRFSCFLARKSASLFSVWDWLWHHGRISSKIFFQFSVLLTRQVHYCPWNDNTPSGWHPINIIWCCDHKANDN